MCKSYKDAWSNLNICFSYTSSKEYKTWLSKQKGKRTYSRTLSLKANWQIFERQMSSKCSESVLARQSYCSNNHTHHSEYSAAVCTLPRGKVTTAEGNIGQTHILDKNSLYRRSHMQALPGSTSLSPIPSKITKFLHAGPQRMSGDF